MTFDHLFIAPSDYESSLRFYVDVLSFEVSGSWGGEGQGPRGAHLKSSGGAMIVLAEKHAPKGDEAWSEGRGFVFGQPTTHFKVHDVDAFARALPTGAELVIQPENTHWGTRWCVLRDPDGILIAVNGPAASTLGEG